MKLGESFKNGVTRVIMEHLDDFIDYSHELKYPIVTIKSAFVDFCRDAVEDLTPEIEARISRVHTHTKDNS
jgi:hypothetical protein